MMNEVKRMRYFDGQFLKEGEFIDDQGYHMYMRRRMNYTLFEKSGVIPMGGGELDIVGPPGPAIKTVTVKAGMAIARNSQDREAREIILFADEAVDLTNHGIGAGQTAFLTLNYEEEERKDPPSEGSVDEPTRVRERAIVSVHSADPGPATGSDYYVQLGTVDFDTMTVNMQSTVREKAQLRSSLVAAGPGPAVPQIVALSGVTSGSPGDANLQAVILGTGLAGVAANGVAFPPGSGVTAVVVTANNTATEVPISIDITNAAPVPQNLSFDVTVGAQTVNSGTVQFAVVAAPLPNPLINAINPTTGKNPATISVFGTNLTTQATPGQPAGDMEIRFVEQGNPSNFVAALNPVLFQVVLGVQEVRATIPVRPASIPVFPAFVDVVVVRGSAQATSPQKFRFQP